MASCNLKQELEDESKQYLVCPKCRNKYLLCTYLDEKEKWKEERINKEKENAKKDGKIFLVYKGGLYYNDPEFGHGDEPEPGPGWLFWSPKVEHLTFFCDCGYYSHNYKDFKTCKSPFFHFIKK